MAASMLLLLINSLLCFVYGEISDAQTTAHLAATNESTLRAINWLTKQRQDDWSWPSDATAKAILALQLSNLSTWYSAENVESQLSGKQLEVELVLHLWRHHEVPVTPGRLAEYSLALSSICKDPRQFHGHDLIGSLQHHEAELDFEFAYSSLAVCSTGTHVRKRQIRRLLEIAEKANDHNVDTLSMVLLALHCIVRDHRNRNLSHYIKKPSIGLAQQQKEDGGFGNLHSTSLAVQALDIATKELSIGDSWNRSSAISYILSHQAPDGSFSGGIGTTAEVILGIGPQGLGSIKDIDCDIQISPAPANLVKLSSSISLSNQALLPTNVSEHELSSPAIEDNKSVTSASSDDIAVTYTLWVSTNMTKNFTMALIVPRNSTFFQVMQLAAEKDSHYKFLTNLWPNGHYVHTLAGYKEEPNNYHYWLLYRLPQLPDPTKPPGNNLVSPVGVDDLIVEDGGHYLFWYKKL